MLLPVVYPRRRASRSWSWCTCHQTGPSLLPEVFASRCAARVREPEDKEPVERRQWSGLRLRTIIC